MTRKQWNTACKNGDLKLLKALHKKSIYGLSTECINIVIRYKHTEIIKWMLGILKNKVSKQAMEFAVSTRDLNIVALIHNNTRKRFTDNAMDIAVLNQDYDIVMFLHKKRAEGCSSLAIYYAVMNKDEPMVEWLYHNRPECKIDEDLIDYANENVGLDMVCFLYSLGAKRLIITPYDMKMIERIQASDVKEKIKYTDKSLRK